MADNLLSERYNTMYAIGEDNDTIVLYMTVDQAKNLQFAAEDSASCYEAQGEDNEAYTKVGDTLYEVSAALNQILH